MATGIFMAGSSVLTSAHLAGSFKANKYTQISSLQQQFLMRCGYVLKVFTIF
jgi:hypothetical protein